MFLKYPGQDKISDLPNFMKIVVVNEGPPAAKGKIAFDTIYALNDGMFPIYEHSLALFKDHFRQRHNLILALFSAKGGRFILYPKGKEPIEAEAPPVAYRLAKSVGHCAMVTYVLVAPYCANAGADLSWRAEMEAYRTRVKSALESLDALDASDLKAQDRELLRGHAQTDSSIHGPMSGSQFFYLPRGGSLCPGLETKSGEADCSGLIHASCSLVQGP